MSEPCPHCGAEAGFEQREQGPHVGLYCPSCGRWVKWLPRGKGQARPVESNPQTPKDPACNRCPELTRVIQELTGINRQLTIVTRALMGSGR